MGSACRATGADCSRGSVKITFLLTQSLESPSGLGRYWPVAKELRRLGHRVTILALHHDWKSLTQRRFVRDGVEVRYVGQMHVRKVGDTKLYFGRLELLTVVVRATLGLLCEALRVSTDAYHVGKPHPMNGVAGLVASRLRRKPLYLDCDDYEAASNRFGGEWQRKVVAFFEDRLPRHAKAVTTNTQAMVDRLRASERSQLVTYVPNGVDRDRFSDVPPERLQMLRSELAIDTEHIILYLGSMSLTSHAVDLLVAAFPAVLEHHPDALLLLVGGGEDFDTLKWQVSRLGIQSRIRFVGRVPPDDAPLYYRLASVTVDPVRADAASAARAPLKLVESWASGRPVVSGAVGDRQGSVAGASCLAVPGDSDSLADCLISILSDPSRLSAMRDQAVLAAASFYWDVLVQPWAAIYGRP